MSDRSSLPISLRIDSEMRRSLLKLTRDEIGARIFYGVTDTAQVLPHSAVVLKGRRVIGWIVELSWEDDRRPAGEIHAETMEAFVSAPNVEIEARSDPTYLPALIVKRSCFRSDNDTTPETEMLCDAGEAVRLTRAFGMVERFRPTRMTLEFASAGVLVPMSAEGSRDWEIVTRSEAEFRARTELRQFGWTTMPTSCTSYLPSELRPYAVPITHLRHGPVPDAIVEFDFRPQAGVHVTGKRYPAHDGFHITIERDGHVSDWKTYETLISASKALRLARETAEAGQRLPETILVDAEDLEAERAAWRAAITAAHTKGLRYTFVPLADRPPGPLSDAPVYG